MTTHAKDIMTTEVVSVLPETSLLEVSQILVDRDFNGVPVLDEKKNVIGIVTEYDLLTKGTAIHLPTFMRFFGDYPVGGGGDAIVKGTFADIFSLRVADVMNREPLTLRETSTIEEVVKTFGRHHRVNPIPIVDAAGTLVGIISRYDVIKFYAGMLSRAERAK